MDRTCLLRRRRRPLRKGREGGQLVRTSTATMEAKLTLSLKVSIREPIVNGIRQLIQPANDLFFYLNEREVERTNEGQLTTTSSPVNLDPFWTHGTELP